MSPLQRRLARSQFKPMEGGFLAKAAAKQAAKDEKQAKLAARRKKQDDKLRKQLPAAALPPIVGPVLEATDVVRLPTATAYAPRVAEPCLPTRAPHRHCRCSPRCRALPTRAVWKSRRGTVRLAHSPFRSSRTRATRSRRSTASTSSSSQARPSGWCGQPAGILCANLPASSLFPD